MTSARVQADEAVVRVPIPPRPVLDVDSAPFWEATARGELALCRCTDCHQWMQPPLERCRSCAAPTEFAPASGRGTVHTFIVVRHASVPGFAHLLPYAIVMVHLEEGVRLTGRYTGDCSTVRIGTPVQACTELLPGAVQHAVAFGPAPGRSGIL